MAKPPAIVEVAAVEVAWKFPKVGVEVATTTPDASVESIELMAAPESVSDGVEIEEVATNVEAVTVPPSKYPLPTTERS